MHKNDAHQTYYMHEGDVALSHTIIITKFQ